MYEDLSYREKEVLKHIVENFIRNALPVGSRFVSKQSDLNLSSATIRNVMSDLEDLDFISTPHTSAGRVPTDKGYRFYVDSLMNKENLSENEMKVIKGTLNEKKVVKDYEFIYSETSKILSKISHQLAIVSQPFLTSGLFKKLEIVQVSSNKILVIIDVLSGLVKTVIMEVDSEIPRNRLEKLTSFLNEKLQGLTLKQIRDSFAERVKDYTTSEPELIQLFINSLDKIYEEEELGSGIHISGTSEIILQPELENPDIMKKVINLAEDKNFVLHIFQANTEDIGVSIKIGNENADEKLKDLSILSKSYHYGEIKGNIGIIGTKRMNYSKMITLLEYTSKLITEFNS
jgi:heat-inducible transcriptional repressor